MFCGWALGTRYSIVCKSKLRLWPPDFTGRSTTPFRVLITHTHPTSLTMANQTSASRRPKRSGASSAKDSALGKKVALDPRVRIQSLKAARDNGNTDDNGAGPSNSSSTPASTSTAVNPNTAGASASSSSTRRPKGKRVPLKRSIPHSMLVRPCGPGKIIMPSVPFVLNFP
jgi:hypothetical protein